MPKILLVEDEVDIAMVVSKRLSAAGHEVLTATDGYQAVEVALRAKPDLVILDLMLPAGGGLSVLKRLRASRFTMLTPVVVLTGMNDEGYKNEVLALGVEAYLQKPYQPDELMGAVNRLTRPKPGAR